MDLKEQIIQEYMQQGSGYRKLQSKYGISRTTICKWIQTKYSHSVYFYGTDGFFQELPDVHK